MAVKSDVSEQILTHLPNLYRICQMLKADFLFPGNMNFMEYKLLVELSSQSGLTLKSLSVRLCVSPSTISPVVQKMVADQFILRQQDLKDRRSFKFKLTRKGERHLLHARNMQWDFWNKIVNGWPQDDINGFIETLKKFTGYCERISKFSK